MVAIASIRIFKDFLLFSFALLICSLVFFKDFAQMFSVISLRASELSILAGVAVLSSVVVHVVTYLTRPREVGSILTLAISLILATNIAFILYWKTGLFSKIEEMVFFILFFFGLTQLVCIFIVSHWKIIPGMINNVLVVGNGALAKDMCCMAQGSNERYELSGFIECRPGEFDCDDSDDELPNVILDKARSEKASLIVVSLSERRGTLPLQQLINCKLSGYEVIDAPEFYERVERKLFLENIRPSSFIYSSGFKILGLRRFIKRIIDIVFSLIGLVIVLPFVPFIALAIKMDSEGPILFKQIRVGQGDRPFTIYKFRTMCKDAEKKSGAVWAKKNDARVTRVGEFLRKSRIDELPQLINSLKGDMSLVGPRPERPEFVKKLKKVIPYYSERHFVKPGITGWAQVCYPYGESEEDAIEKLRYDLYYIKNYSLKFDYRIMLETVSVMAKKMGQ